jgi:predicted flap endonuclease-1-like 5' DNA nuclease
MPALAEIEGIGAVYQQKLQDAGVESVEALLERGASPAGRKQVAAASGALLLEWVNHADLFRIHGVGSEDADLLEAAGVDAVPELAQRDAGNLADTMAHLNEGQAPRSSRAVGDTGAGPGRRGQGPPTDGHASTRTRGPGGRLGCPPVPLDAPSRGLHAADARAGGRDVLTPL